MKLIPPLEYIDGVKSRAERRVAELLARVNSDAEAVAYHSIHLPEHAYKIMSEVDFVVLWRGAVIVLEVKGGRLRRQDGVWVFTDRFGHENRKAESPWEQAHSAMFALRQRLDRAVPGPRLAFGAAVITPDQVLAPDVEWAPWEWGGPAAMRLDSFTKLLDQAAAHARDNIGDKLPRSLKPLKDTLRRDFDRIVRLSDEAGIVDRQMAELVAGQVAVLDVIESNPRVVVEGGAGTGKTLLAIEAARRRAMDHGRVAFICRSGGVVALAKRLLVGSSAQALKFDDLASEEKFDVLVIDEGQDLVNVDDLRVIEEALAGGLECGIWWLFLDPNNQAHIDGDFEVEMYDQLRAWATYANLKSNMRNTRHIVTQVQTYLGADVGAPRIGEGPKVAVARLRGAAGLAKAVDERLCFLKDEGADPGEIAIVTLALEPRETSLPTDGSLGLLEYRGSRVTVPVFSARDIKGLEVRHVLVTDIGNLDDEGAVSRLYVAMTRAQVTLWLAIDELAWGQMAEMARVNVSKESGK